MKTAARASDADLDLWAKTVVSALRGSDPAALGEALSSILERVPATTSATARREPSRALRAAGAAGALVDVIASVQAAAPPHTGGAPGGEGDKTEGGSGGSAPPAAVGRHSKQLAAAAAALARLIAAEPECLQEIVVSAGGGSAASALAAPGVPAVIAQVLSLPPAAAQSGSGDAGAAAKAAAASACALLSQSDGGREAVVAAGCVPALLALAGSSPPSSDAAREACGALAAVAKAAAGAEAIAAAGGCATLASVLSNASPGAATPLAATALAAVALGGHSAAVKPCLREPVTALLSGLLSTALLSKLLSTGGGVGSGDQPPQQQQSDGVAVRGRALANLLVLPLLDTILPVFAAVVGPQPAALGRLESVCMSLPFAAEGGSRLLAYVVASTEELTALARGRGLTARLGAALWDDSTATATAAANFFNALAGRGNFPGKRVAVEAGAIPAVTALLASDDDAAAEAAARAVCAIAGDMPKSAEAFRDAGALPHLLRRARSAKSAVFATWFVSALAVMSNSETLHMSLAAAKVGEAIAEMFRNLGPGLHGTQSHLCGLLVLACVYSSQDRNVLVSGLLAEHDVTGHILKLFSGILAGNRLYMSATWSDNQARSFAKRAHQRRRTGRRRQAHCLVPDALMHWDEEEMLSLPLVGDAPSANVFLTACCACARSCLYTPGRSRSATPTGPAWWRAES